MVRGTLPTPLGFTNGQSKKEKVKVSEGLSSKTMEGNHLPRRIEMVRETSLTSPRVSNVQAKKGNGLPHNSSRNKTRAYEAERRWALMVQGLRRFK